MIPEVSDYVLARTGKVAEFGAMIWTWRGVPSHRTVLKLKVLGLGLWDINLLMQSQSLIDFSRVLLSVLSLLF